jgi:hypothetical protein
VPDDTHDGDVDDILQSCVEEERQYYVTLIENYNRAKERTNCSTSRNDNNVVEKQQEAEVEGNIVREATRS